MKCVKIGIQFMSDIFAGHCYSSDSGFLCGPFKISFKGVSIDFEVLILISITLAGISNTLCNSEFNIVKPGLSLSFQVA